MNRDRVRDLLRSVPVPDEHEAEERGWRVVRAAFGQRPAAPQPRRRLSRLAIAIALVALVLVLALTPAGAKVADLVQDVVQPGEDNARPALTSLPASGRLLVSSARGAWIVNEDGSKRLLGDYTDATWSPSGLYVAVTRGRELTAVDPAGTVRWSLASPHPVSNPAWAPSGFRVAYVSGNSLRLVAGDGTGDRRLVRYVAPVAPAWRPLAKRHVLAYIDRRGSVRVLDLGPANVVGTGPKRELWRVSVGETPVHLSWSPSGRRLIALSPHAARLLDGRGRVVAEIPAPPGARFRRAAFAPRGGRLALLSERRTAAGGRSKVLVLRLGGENAIRQRMAFPFSGRFSDLVWSPDARWLLLGWRDADQWLFIRPRHEKVVAVSNIARQFAPGATGPAPFPSVSGWCCAP